MEASAGKIMIPITDLRIGNWFLGGWLGESYLQVVPAYISAWSGESGNFPPPKPISLTPIILEKCGFTKSSIGHYFDNYRLPNGYGIAHCIENTNTDAEGRPYHKKGSFYCGTTEREIKYLHRLQNLVYEICDYELNYTP